tara:strand:+ start:208 stop:408 length:201 start_codon:yes stop_codon:yes gene_type:complete
MDAEFTALTEKIELLVDTCSKLRENNLALRQQIATMRSENDHLNRKVTMAITKLEELVDKSSTSEL